MSILFHILFDMSMQNFVPIGLYLQLPPNSSFFSRCMMTDESMTSTRQRTWWLIGHPECEITSARLPSKGQVLRKFYFHHGIEKKTKSVAAKEVIEAVLLVWGRAGIPTSALRTAKEKLLSLVAKYESLQKHRKRASETARMKEEMFTGDLEDLFDVASSDALDRMTVEEDKAFLRSQREDRATSSMAGLDCVMVEAQERKKERERAEEMRKEHWKKEKEAMTSVVLSDRLASSSSSAAGETDDSDVDFTGPSHPKRTKVEGAKSTALLSVDITSTLDRFKVSDRVAMGTMGAFVAASGQNLGSLSLSRSTIRRHRIRNREAIAKLETIIIPEGIPVLVHWDGKLLPDLSGKDQVDRIAILVTAGGREHLLGVPKIPRSTGTAQGEAVLKAITEAQLQTRVQGLVFDTTASNTGLYEGACVKIQEGLGRELLWVPCRHHVLEVVMGDVFKSSYGPSRGPNIPLFVRFRDRWSLIDQSSWSSAMKKDSLHVLLTGELSEHRGRALHELKSALEKGTHPREDYEELIWLSYLFLGGNLGKDYRFRAPGAFHHARWMAKGIYALKVFLFRGQVKLTAYELQAMEDISLFVALLYATKWNEAMVPQRAPLNDLLFMRDLSRGIPKPEVADIALKAFRRHLWYVSEDLVALSFMDERISNEEKKAMVRNLFRRERKGLKRLDGKRFSPDIDLEDLVTSKTRRALHSLLPGRDEEVETLLEKSPETWETEATFLDMKRNVSQMKVVNDAAERGVALATSFNSIITKDEAQQQYLLKVVAKHRREQPSTSKAALMD